MTKKKTNQSKQEAALQKPPIPDKSETYTTFALWQAAAIAHAVSKLANWIEAIGDKKSTLNKIDALRRAIVYISNSKIYSKLKAEEAESKLIEFHDLLLTTLEKILPYYKSVNKKPVPAETIENLKKLAKQLQQYAGEYKDHVPLETVTDEMRQLADDIPHYNYPDICLTGRASAISFLLGAIVCDLYEAKQLTEDEIQAKSYLSQAGNILSDFALKRFWPKDEKEQQKFKTKISEDIIHFANQLDKSPVVKQYQDFARILSGTENSLIIFEKTNPSDSESNKSRKHLSEKDIKRFFEKKPKKQKPADDLEYLKGWILRIEGYMEYIEKRWGEIEKSNSVLPDAERYDVFTNQGVVNLYNPTHYETIALTSLNRKYPFSLQPIKKLLDDAQNDCKCLCDRNPNPKEKLRSGEILNNSLIELQFAIRTAVEGIERSRGKISDSEKSGDEKGGKNKQKPLSDKEDAVLKLLEALPKRKGIIGRKILKSLDKQQIYIDHSTLTKSIIPRLKQKGYKIINNRDGAGYYLEK